MSKLDVYQKITVDLKMDELDVTAAENKATYEEIREYVKEHTGLNVSNLYIAQVKRKCGIKDYGTIFPGHGGILDRFDSVMFIAPFVTMVVIAVFYH